MSNSPRQVVVDDSDSSILYSSTWFVDDSGNKDGLGNFGPTLKSTLHGTNSSGSLKFAFSGTGMDVYGTTNVANVSGKTDPSWECFIDDVSTQPFQFFENNWLLCSTQNLTDTSHVLTVNAASHGHTFWLDYLQYTPSNTDTLNEALVFVPHTDPDIIYDVYWERLGDIANMTSVKGSTATFNFTGVSVAWYGDIPKELPISPSLATYSIDGGAENPIVLKGLVPGEVTQYFQIFFETSTLPSGPHSITVTFESDDTSTPLTLDHLLVQNGMLPIHPNQTSSLTPTFSPTSTSTSISSLSSRTKKTNVAGIVCGVLGAILLLCLLAFLFLRYRKQRNATRTPAKITIMNPFTLRPPIPRPIETTSFSTLNLFGPPSTPSLPSTHAPPAHIRRRSNNERFDQDNQPSGSQPNRRGSRAPALDNLNENASYYGGYQTWGQTKALEVISGSRSRDSYM